MDDSSLPIPYTSEYNKLLVGNVPDLDISFPEVLDQKLISKNKFLSDLQTLSITLKQKKFPMLTVKKDREVSMV